MNTPFEFRGVMVVGVPYIRGEFDHICRMCVGGNPESNACEELPQCPSVIFIPEADQEAWMAKVVAHKLMGEN